MSLWEGRRPHVLPRSGHRDAIVVISLWEIRFSSALLKWEYPEDRDCGRHFRVHQYLEILSFPGIGVTTLPVPLHLLRAV